MLTEDTSQSQARTCIKIPPTLNYHSHIILADCHSNQIHYHNQVVKGKLQSKLQCCQEARVSQSNDVDDVYTTEKTPTRKHTHPVTASSFTYFSAMIIIPLRGGWAVRIQWFNARNLSVKQNAWRVSHENGGFNYRRKCAFLNSS